MFMMCENVAPYFPKTGGNLYYTAQVNVRIRRHDHILVVCTRLSPSDFPDWVSSRGSIFMQTYSYFSAVTGVIVAALSAGYKPDSKPMIVAKMRVNGGSQAGVDTATEGGGAPVCTDWPAM